MEHGAEMAGPRPPAVRKATSEDVPALAAALARAFYDDPVFQWLLPDPGDRLARAERGFAFYLRRVYLPHDECYTSADGEVVGGALWLPPEQWHQGVLAQLRLAPGMLRATGRRMAQVMRAIATIESKHPRERHYYLPFVGVEPAAQGRGLGTALMRPIIEGCDRESLPAYLESTTPRNRACYERQGFEVTEEFTFPRGGPPSWRMWRAPRPAAAS